MHLYAADCLDRGVGGYEGIIFHLYLYLWLFHLVRPLRKRERGSQ